MAQKPSVPQTVPNAKESPATPSWLFLFYQWVKQTISGIAGGAAGDVLYSDGADGVSHEAAFNYNATTNALSVGSVSATTTLAAGTTVTAGTGITATTGNITATAGNFVLPAGYLALTEIADPGFAGANQAWLHAEDVAGITQIHHNTSTHKWTVGQDNWIVARNVTGSSIPALRAVHVTGSTGARPEITMSDADLHNHALGVTQDTIANNGYGAVVVSGYVKGVDTSGWTAGDALYVGTTAGVLQNTAPAFPAAKQRVATVIYSHATQGIIQVFHHEDVREGDGTWETPFTIGDGTTAGEIRLLEPSAGGGTNYTGFKAPSLASNVVYTLPTADGTAGYPLTTNGLGTLSWAQITSAAVSDFTEAAQDAVGAALTDSSTIDFTYNDAAGTITAAVIVAGLSGIDHGSQLTGLADDDHTQYVLLAGRSGGQIVRGGTGASDSLTLRSTSNATKGNIALADEGGNVVLGGGATASELRFLEPSGSGTHYTAFKAQAQAGDVTYTLPAADGSANDVLTTNGSGTLSWAAGGSGSDSAPMTPQGRLTLTAATPVMTAEAANQTTIYYTPYVGDLCPIYNGSTWDNTQFAELSIAMAASANWAANSNFDVYVYNDAGTLRLVTGAAWTNDTTRSESLTRVNGIWTNNASMTGRYGASSTVTVAANRGTYVGTIRTTGSTGTTTWELGGTAAGGDPGFLYVWNCYNRLPVSVGVGDSTDSWTYSTTTIRSWNNSTSNRVTFVRGLNDDEMAAAFTSLHTHSGGAAIALVGLDSTSAMVGAPGNVNTTSPNAVTSHWRGPPGLGMHYIQALEYSSGATGTFYGDAGAPTLAQSKLHVSGMF